MRQFTERHHGQWLVTVVREDEDIWPDLMKECEGIRSDMRLEPAIVRVRFPDTGNDVSASSYATVDGYQITPAGKIPVWGEKFWVSEFPWLEQLIQQVSPDAVQSVFI